MMTLSSFSIWVQLGLLAMFVVLVSSLLIGFYLKADHKYERGLSGQTFGSGKLGFFQRDKRRADRVPCYLVFELRDKTEHGSTGSGRLLNLSTTGACLSSRVALSLGELIQGRVRSEEAEDVRISGRVVWARPTAGTTLYGIRFR